MARPRLILINGPAGAGKDTGGNALLAAFPGAVVIKFAETVKRVAHDLYALPPHTPIDAFEDCKDRRSSIFMGRTPREVYIEVSERMVKPRLGERWFGDMFERRAVRAWHAGAPMVIATDSGFVAEAEPVLAGIGRNHALLIRVHADARGKSFAGDSRSHIELPGVYTVDLRNDVPDNPASFCGEVVRTVREWLRRAA